MQTIAYVLLVINGLVVVYLGMVLINLSKIRKHLKVLMDNGLEIFPKHIGEYITEHLNHVHYLHQGIKVEKMLKEFIKTHIEEK